MTIIEFLQYFPDETSCKTHFKEQREKQGVICKACGSKNIIGFRANGNGSVRGVVSEQLYEAEQSCNLLSYLFINGTCVWLL